MTERPVAELARELDAHYAKASAGAVPAPRFHERPTRARLTPMGGVFALASVLVALLGAAWLGARMQQPSPTLVAAALRVPTPLVVASPPSPAVLPESRCPRGIEGRQVLPAGCRVEFAQPPMVVTTAQTSTLEVSPDRVTMHGGWAVFDVEHRDQSPLRVRFDAGEIVVIGTVFSVFQDDVRGHVELVEGKIQILESSGPEHLLEAGERFGWQRDAPPTTSAASEFSPSPRPKAAPPNESIDDVARLRSKKKWREAEALLRRLRARADTAREREVLDYELGTVLEARGADGARRCAHWQTFASRYASGRYADVARKRIEALQCD